MAQENAKQILMANGVSVTVPTPAQIRLARETLLSSQDQFVEELQIDPDLLKQIEMVLQNDA